MYQFQYCVCVCVHVYVFYDELSCYSSLLTDTSITVDAFSYGDIDGCNAYFLTHFHSDHYTGLNSRFKQHIYCSRVCSCTCLNFIYFYFYQWMGGFLWQYCFMYTYHV